MNGTLFLVVGPSGAGKDSVIDGARRRLDGNASVFFARRVITRPADSGGEEHREISASAFERLEGQGGFALSWRAHGLAYGIPADIERRLAAGTSVVANASRAAIDAARLKYPRLKIVLITVPPEVLAQRLAARGRESADDIRARLERAGEIAVAGDDVVTIVNDGPLENAVERLVGLFPTNAQVV